MFVAALMMVPVAIMMKWYMSSIDYEWKAYWISIICFDVFTWLVAFMYGFAPSPPLAQLKPGSPKVQPQRFNIYHPICVGVVTILWICSFVSTLLWGLIGYSGYKYDTDDLLARYADYIMMVAVNLWIIGEVLSEDEGYVDIDIDAVDYQQVPQIEDYSRHVDNDILL